MFNSRRRQYDGSNWYWSVNGDPENVFSSASASVVPVSDPNYQAWIADPAFDTGPSRIASFNELYDVLVTQAPAVAAQVGLSWHDAGYLTPDQSYAVLLTHGLEIESTGSPSINGLYAVDDASRSAIGQLDQYYQKFGKFPSGGSTVIVIGPDDAHHEVSETDLANIGEVIGAYAYGVILTRSLLNQNQSASWPARSVSIA